jgi:hypothetical protein
MLRRHWLFSLAVLAIPSLIVAVGPPSKRPTGPAAPPEPAVYDAQIRYQIRAFRSVRVRQFEEMLRAFRAAGWKRDPAEDVPEDEPENPDATRMSGTIPAAGVPRILRERHVQAVLLLPRGVKLPDKERPVRVDLGLTPGLLPQTQRRLADQVRAVLAGLGFREAIGYDDRGASRLVGSVPAGQVPTLLGDLRKLPGAVREAAPFRVRSPLRLIVARPDLPVPAERPAPPAVPEGQEKLTPELRELLADAEGAAKPVRMEVVLAETPAAGDRDWSRPLALPGLALEGRLGPLVSVRGQPRPHALELAALPEVTAVRLPRAAQPPAEGGKGASKWEPLRASGLARLHALGRRGKGIRVALVANDFRGWETLKGRKEGKVKLPDPVLLDLTRERNRDLQPDPYPAGGGAVGAGTRYARALLRAAPEAELTLVRIDAAAPYMLQTVARAINGEEANSVGIEQRLHDLDADREALAGRREKLLEERRAVLDDLRDDPELVKRRAAYRTAQAQFDRDERAYNQRMRSLLKFQRELRALRGIRVVASTLVWTDGYPVDGSSALSRYFDDRPFRAALWFQAAGDTHGQSWSGLFRDRAGDGVLEFTAPGARLPRGAWTGGLDFLAWRGRDGKVVRDLPAGARIRVSLQWREVHDPAPLRAGEDPYREPLARLRLVLLRQPDPDGKKQPADDLEVVVQSAGLPQRLSQTARAATYEQVVELRVPQAGRYAIRVEGKVPETLHAPGEAAASLPTARKFGELRVRLFVRTLAGPGRAVLADYRTAAGAVGMPADAHRVVSVGAAGPDGRPQPSSARGAPFNLALLRRPDVLAFDEGEGTAGAAAFAAGLLATTRTAGLQTHIRAPEGRPAPLLRVPPPRPRP